jgi:cobalt-precorrin-5B (C1)-methyltransferase
MIRAALEEIAAAHGLPPPDLTATFSIPGGEALARKTMNARLGILGGLSILGTTGIVVPYSCAAWIHSIERGIDVARAAGLEHIAAATGAVSERAVQRLYRLPDHALLDIGDFVGGTLKYLRRHPVGRLTIGGGFAKLAKLAQGHLDLHSAKSRLDPEALVELLRRAGADPATCQRVRGVESAGAILAGAGEAQTALAERVAAQARAVALATLSGGTAVEVVVVGRDGGILALVGG